MPREHVCHWPGCTQRVPQRLWGCRAHWFALPGAIRAEILRTYRPGQEITKDPSPAYIQAAQRAQAWIAQQRESENQKT